MKIEFHATVEGNGCIRYDGDGGCVVKLTVPASEIGYVTQLLAHREKLLKIVVEAK